MIVKNLSALQIHQMSKEQYERELAAGRIDENALYLTPDEITEETVIFINCGTPTTVLQ